MKRLKIILAAVMLAITAILSGCNDAQKEIPSDSKPPIETAVETLGVDLDTFNGYLDAMHITYNDFLSMLSSQNTDIAGLKEMVEKNYDCTYLEYIKTLTLLNSGSAPSSDKYVKLNPAYNLYDAYFPADRAKLITNDDPNIKSYIQFDDIVITVAETDANVNVFDNYSNLSANFQAYMNYINKTYGADKVIIEMPLTLNCNHGIKKPTEENKLLENNFKFNADQEIIEEMAVTVVGICKGNDVTYYGLSNELGLLFKTANRDALYNLENIEIRITYTNKSAKAD